MKLDVDRGAYERLRIWTPPDAPIASPDLPSNLDACVEWRGKRPGHPSTYGLLGGTLRRKASPALLATGPFEVSLAARGDVVTLGLTDPAARLAIESAEPGLTVAVAAEGAFGSSPIVFFVLAAICASLIRDGVPEENEGIWDLFEVAARRASEWGEQHRSAIAAARADRRKGGV